MVELEAFLLILFTCYNSAIRQCVHETNLSLSLSWTNKL